MNYNINTNMNPSLFPNYTWNNIINNGNNSNKNDDDDHQQQHHNDPMGMAMDQHTHLHIFNPFSSSYFPPLSSSHTTTTLYSGDQEDDEYEEEPIEELGAMKEMMYRIAAMQPVDIDPATIKKPRRRNVKISDDPQSVAARHRRERISERIRILQRLVPGGTKMDTSSMLDEAIRYVKFLKRQIRLLNNNPGINPPPPPVKTSWVSPPPPQDFGGEGGSSGGELI